MKKDMISHPAHYQSKNGLEVIDVIEAFTCDLTGIEAIDTANILKYACRWKKKNGTEDLRRLIWYADHLINHLEKNEIIYDNEMLEEIMKEEIKKKEVTDPKTKIVNAIRERSGHI